MDDIIKNLKCFTGKKKKIHLICSCDDELIHTISHLLYNFLHNRFKVKNSKKTYNQLFKIRHAIRKLADRRVSIRVKREILVGIAVRTILFPLIQENFVPSLLKSMK